MKINSYSDAETYVTNSGVNDWEFGGNANLESLTEFVYQNWDNELFDENDISDTDQFNNLLCDYLESVDERIADYSLRRY